MAHYKGLESSDESVPPLLKDDREVKLLLKAFSLVPRHL